MVLVTRRAPDFTAPAVLGNGTIIDKFNLKSYIHGSTAVIFFWPMDFTFVCPSELIAFDNRYLIFKERGTKIIGISGDSEFAHYAWRLIPIEKGGIGKVQYPMISDIKHEIMKSYGIEHLDMGVALRASFLIKKDGIICHQIVNDLPFGRNIDEIIRMIDALKFYEENGEVCPAQWSKGKYGIQATQEGIEYYLSKYKNEL